MSDPVTQYSGNSKQARRLARRWSRKQAHQQAAADAPAPEAAPSTESDPARLPEQLKADAPASAGRLSRPPAQQKVDVSMIAIEQCTVRSFPPALRESRHGDFQVILHRSALDAIAAHAQSRTDVEICGVLVGDIFRDEAGPYLEIDACIAGAAAASHVANVTFTADTWQHIQGEMDHFHSGKKIVGWYHSHPDFGIFLSKMDLFIHENFFNLPWQAAFVRDPVRREEGLFIWRHGVASAEEFLIDETEGAREPAPGAVETMPNDPAQTAWGAFRPPSEAAALLTPEPVHNMVGHLIAAAIERPEAPRQPLPETTGAQTAYAPHLANPFDASASRMPSAFAGAGAFHDAALDGAAIADISMRLRRIEKRQKSLGVVLAIGLLMLIAWPLVVVTLLSDRSTATFPRPPDSRQAPEEPSSSTAGANRLNSPRATKLPRGAADQVAFIRSVHPLTAMIDARARKFSLSSYVPFLFSWQTGNLTMNPAASGIARAAGRSPRKSSIPRPNLSDAAVVAHATIPPAPVSAPAQPHAAANQAPAAAASVASKTASQPAAAGVGNDASQIEPASASNSSDDAVDEDTLPLRMDPNGGGGAKVIEVDR